MGATELPGGHSTMAPSLCPSALKDQQSYALGAVRTQGDTAPQVTLGRFCSVKNSL